MICLRRPGSFGSGIPAVFTFVSPWPRLSRRSPSVNKNWWNGLDLNSIQICLSAESQVLATVPVGWYLATDVGWEIRYLEQGLAGSLCKGSDICELQSLWQRLSSAFVAWTPPGGYRQGAWLCSLEPYFQKQLVASPPLASRSVPMTGRHSSSPRDLPRPYYARAQCQDASGDSTVTTP